MEPMNVEFPKDNFLQKVKELAHKHGAIFIFDEMITGFRFAKGGAQEYFGVTPDLATFGKGVANGYPLSIVTGKQGLMKLMEAVFFSFTFGGETLSLAAANAVINKMNQQPVIEHLAALGRKAEVGIKQLIAKHNLQHCLDIVGHPSWTILSFKDTEHYSLWEIKTLWLQEVLARGILTFGSHNISYAHIALDLERLLTVYDEVFAIVASALTSHMLKEQLKCEPLQPLFSVR